MAMRLRERTNDGKMDRGMAADGIVGLCESSAVSAPQNGQEMNGQHDNIKNRPLYVK
jgi:hypothetical protein